MEKRRLLFICKDRSHEYEPNKPMTTWNQSGATGLLTSVLNVVGMLNGLLAPEGIPVEAKVVVVRDNNDIDREVHGYRPTDVIIEGLWVVPDKFDILKRLHPKVRWIIRLHSEIPFIATEGMSMHWCNGYAARDVQVAANSERLAEALRIIQGLHVIDLPNYYCLDHETPPRVKHPHGQVHVGCFGAIRPLKNHLIQAVAAIEFAHQIKHELFFHTNTERVDQGGLPVLHNVRGLFERQPDAALVEHPWFERERFLSLVATVDIAMQVSFTETFNIVGADCTMMGVPLVSSPEVRWNVPELWANPTSLGSIVAGLHHAWKHGRGEHGVWREAFRGLEYSNEIAARAWRHFLIA